MGLWDVLGLAAIAVYIFTIRGFGPSGQPHDTPFPIWPKVGGRLMGKNWPD